MFSSLRLKVFSISLLILRWQRTDSLVGWQLSIDDLNSFIEQPSCCGPVSGMRAARRLGGVWVDVGDVGEDEGEACVVRPIVELASFACSHMP